MNPIAMPTLPFTKPIINLPLKDVLCKAPYLSSKPVVHVVPESARVRHRSRMLGLGFTPESKVVAHGSSGFPNAAVWQCWAVFAGLLRHVCCHSFVRSVPRVRAYATNGERSSLSQEPVAACLVGAGFR